MLSLSFSSWLKIGPIETIFGWGSTPRIDSEEIEDINQWPKTFTDKLNWILNRRKQTASCGEFDLWKTEKNNGKM